MTDLGSATELKEVSAGCIVGNPEHCQRVGFPFYITDQIKVHISFLLWCEENINWETDREIRQQIN